VAVADQLGRELRIGDDGTRHRAADAGRIASRPPGPLATFLYGALCETEMVVARADDQKAAHRQAVGEIGCTLDGLATN
jgi:hypothetical protein